MSIVNERCNNFSIVVEFVTMARDFIGQMMDY